MKAELIYCEDPRWRRMLASTEHDFYHLPEYCAFAADGEHGVAAAIYTSSGSAECLIPLVLRPVPAALDAVGGARDAASPYGYASPLLTPDASPQFIRDALSACFDAAAREGLVSLFLRLHPILTAGREELSSLATVVRHGETVFVDLMQPVDELQKTFASGHRYEIRRLQRLGFRTSFDDWDRLAQFGDIYRQTMRRVEAQASYLFADNYFFGLRASLGDMLHLCLVHDSEGTLAGGALFTDCCGLMQYHLSGVDDAFVRLSPTKLALADIIRWGSNRGRRVLHLGGGVGGSGDSLFRFKAGFSDGRGEFYSCRLVTRPESYEYLLDRWRRGVPAENASNNFFPAYRAVLS